MVMLSPYELAHQPANTALQVLLIEEFGSIFTKKNVRKHTLRVSRLLVVSHFLHHFFVIISTKENMPKVKDMFSQTYTINL